MAQTQHFRSRSQIGIDAAPSTPHESAQQEVLHIAPAVNDRKHVHPSLLRAIEKPPRRKHNLAISAYVVSLQFRHDAATERMRTELHGRLVDTIDEITRRLWRFADKIRDNVRQVLDCRFGPEGLAHVRLIARRTALIALACVMVSPASIAFSLCEMSFRIPKASVIS